MTRLIVSLLFTLLSATTLLASPTTPKTSPGTCKQCTSNPIVCDITAPCASAFGQKLYCGW